MAKRAEESRHNYSLDKDKNLLREVETRDMTSDPHFKAGSSKRLWNELFKVLDSSDVVLYVLDARDPMGTRSKYIEQYMKKEKPNKHFIFVINKVDLVPVWITVRSTILLILTMISIETLEEDPIFRVPDSRVLCQFDEAFGQDGFDGSLTSISWTSCERPPANQCWRHWIS